jgi:hypothetical protein
MKSTLPSLHHFNGSLRFLTVLWPLHQLTSIWKLSLEWTCSWILDLYQFIALDDLLELEVDQTSPSLQLDPGQCSFFCIEAFVAICQSAFQMKSSKIVFCPIVHFHKRFGSLSYSYYLLPCHEDLCWMLTVCGVCIWASLGGLPWWRAWSHN